MTEKVKITHEQADAIEKYKSNGHKLKEFVVHGERGFHGYYEALKGLPIDDMARLLYEPNSYEIEPEPLKVGEWAKITHEIAGTYIGEILEIKTDHSGVEVARALWNYQHSSSLLPLEIAVKCTPEEIKTMKEKRLWSHQVRRGVKDFHEDDIVLNKFKTPYIVGEVSQEEDGFITFGTAEQWYELGIIKGLYRAESLISFEEVEPNAETHN